MDVKITSLSKYDYSNALGKVLSFHGKNRTCHGDWPTARVSALDDFKWNFYALDVKEFHQFDDGARLFLDDDSEVFLKGCEITEVSGIPEIF